MTLNILRYVGTSFRKNKKNVNLNLFNIRNISKRIRKINYINPNSDSFYSITKTVMAFGFTLIMINNENTILYNEPKKDINDKDINLIEARHILQEKIKNCREKLKLEKNINFIFPKIFAGTIPGKKTSNGEPDMLRVEFTSPEIILTLKSFLNKLNQSNQEDLLIVNPNDNENTNILSFSFADGKGSLTISNKNKQNYNYTIFKDDFITLNEINAIVEAYKMASLAQNGYSDNKNKTDHKIGTKRSYTPDKSSLMGSFPGEETNIKIDSRQAAIEELDKLGVKVYQPNIENQGLDWGCMAGNDEIKKEIEESLVLALENPEIYENIAKETRKRYESNRPRFVLFEGPPGTGKTFSAKILAEKTKIPLFLIPTELILSKYYGESEKKLSTMLQAIYYLSNSSEENNDNNTKEGAIIFIDEVDSIGGKRDSMTMHEASRRLLSVLLTKVDGFQSSNHKTTLICATNRKEDLDSALLSRFDLIIKYNLPDEKTRAQIFNRYARHLTSNELSKLAFYSMGMSCRDIKEICEYTERKWASKLIKNNEKISVPDINAYISALDYRQNTLINDNSNNNEHAVA